MLGHCLKQNARQLVPPPQLKPVVDVAAQHLGELIDRDRLATALLILAEDERRLSGPGSRARAGSCQRGSRFRACRSSPQTLGQDRGGATRPAGGRSSSANAHTAMTIAFLVPILANCWGPGATGISTPAAGRCDVTFNRNLTGCVTDIQSSPAPSSWLMPSQTLLSSSSAEQFGFSFDDLGPNAVAVIGFQGTSETDLLTGQFGAFKLLVFC